MTKEIILATVFVITTICVAIMNGGDESSSPLSS